MRMASKAGPGGAARRTLLASASLAIGLIATPATAQTAGPAQASGASNAGSGAADGTAGSPGSSTPAGIAADGSGQGLEEIIVTARRRAEALQDVPIAVQAFSGAQLEERNIQDATDLQRLVPALTTYQQARDEITLSLRGQASSGASAQGQNPRVTAYFAEVPLQTSDTGPGRFFDLQNVQVLKGPQGTLFGRNSTGGAVLYEPRRPTKDFEGYVIGQIGRFDERQVEAAVNTPVSEGLALRFAGKRSKRDGFTKNLTTGQRQDDRDYWAGRVSALLAPSDDIQSFFMFDYLKSDTNGSSQQFAGFNPNKALTADVFENTPQDALLPELPLFLGGNRPAIATLRTSPQAAIGQAIAAGGFAFAPSPLLENQLAAQQAGGPRVTLSNVNGISRNRSWGLTNISEIDLGGSLSLKNILGYRRNKQLSRYDLDGTALPLLDQTTPDGWSVNLRQITEELQLQGSALDDKLEFTLGGFLLWEKTPSTQELIQISVGTPSQSLTDRKERSQALFGQLTYDLSDLLEGLSVTGGYRYTHDYRWIRQDNRRDPAGRFPIASCSLLNGCPTTTSASFNASSYNFSLDWKVADDTLLYATHRRGYRAGGLNPQALDFGVNYEPETVTDFELGLKTDFTLGTMEGRTNFAAFRSKLKDAQVSQSFSTLNPVNNQLALINLIVNAASATIEGLEVDASLVPFEGLNLSASYALTDAEYDSFLNVATGLPETNRPFPFLAKHRLSLGARYTLPLPETVGDVSLGANWTYSSRYTISVFEDPLGEENGYNQLDLRADWNNIGGSNLSAGVFVNNVTNEIYKIGGVPIISVLGTTSLIYNEPRTWGLQLRYAFGG